MAAMASTSAGEETANATQTVAELFESMSYGPAPEADNVAQVKLQCNCGVLCKKIKLAFYKYKSILQVALLAVAQFFRSRWILSHITYQCNIACCYILLQFIPLVS